MLLYEYTFFRWYVTFVAFHICIYIIVKHNHIAVLLEICFIQILLRTSKYSQGVKTRPLNNLKCDIQHNFLGEKILIFTGIFQDFILCNIISLLCFISKCKNMREISNRRIDTRPLINSFTFASLKDFLLFFFLFLVMIPTLPQFVYIFLIGLLYFG